MTRHLLLRGLLVAVTGCALTLVAEPGRAKDLGARGVVWPVAEPDLLREVETRLREMDASGDLARMRREALERARERIEVPGRVAGIVPAVSRRTRLFDPSVTVERDIRTHDGTLIAARGARINPLDMHPLTRDLLFIDGARPVEVAWALRHHRPARIVLLAGRPLALARAHGRRFFFDQGGRLSKRFGLRSTPSLVAAEGSMLRITEVPLQDESNATAAGGRP
ncbi:MAG: type-F conjugative transfer system protein TraW [Deltaproteobacteria bacterium]|nr:type-F conjugative transfer system protein TraW [Deltaproteobacteria bacterium]